MLGQAAAETGVYRWVAPDGTVIFSDQPRPGAEKVDIKPAQTVPPPEAVRRVLDEDSREQSRGPTAYSEFAIVSPAQDEPVRANNGDVTISMQLTPALRAKHAIVVSMDGQKVGEGTSTQLTLQNLPRGTHTVQAAVVDAAGVELARTEMVTFHLQRRRLPTLRAVPQSGGS